MLVAAVFAGCAAVPDTPKTPAKIAAFEIKQLDVTPVPRFQARPQYPAEFAKNKVTGEATVDFVVDADGNVQGAFALRATHPDFGTAAVAAVEKWKFKPGIKAGRAVPTHMQVPIVFEMDKAPPASEAAGIVFEVGTQRREIEAVDISKLDVMPVAKFQARPQYPFELRRQSVSGEAVVDFIVDVNGDVRNAFVLRATHPEFGPAALASVVQWKFKPGMLRGRVVNTHMQVPIVFTLNTR
jgi:TonB family protein